MRKNKVTIKKKKFFISNSLEALIQFKEEHQGSIETTCTFVGGTRRNFLRSRKITCEGAFQNLMKSSLSFLGLREVLIKEKRRDSRRKRFYSDIWKDAIRGAL